MKGRTNQLQLRARSLPLATHSELGEKPVDELVKDDTTSSEGSDGILLVGEVDDGPVVGAEEERAEGLLVELKNELNERAEAILLDLSNVL